MLTGLAACGEPSPLDFNPGSTSGGINLTSTTYYEDGAGADETGEERPDVVNGCLQTPDPGGIQGVVHQCVGLHVLTINFDVVGAGEANGPKSISLPVFFGPSQPDESYGKPKVMACCEPYDGQPYGGAGHENIWESPHHRACYHDFVENGCLSLSARLYALKQEMPLLLRPQVQALADWTALHTEECYQEFWLASAASVYVPDDSSFPASPGHTWSLPGSAETLNLENIEIVLQNGIYLDPFLPEDPEDRLLCDSAQDNKDVRFLLADPDPELVYELLQGDIELEGVYAEAALSGIADLASADTSCTTCSHLALDALGPRLEALLLESEDPATVQWTPSPMVDVQRFRIALYDGAPATLVASRHWQVAAGAAHFLVSGLGHGGSGALSVHNRTPIDIRYVTLTGHFEIDPFELRYVDSSSETWTLSVSFTEWE